MQKNLLLFIFSLLMMFAGYGQNESDKPKIGLVMSGGGAKGLAHIGVLKVLEEQGVKVDYIAGTSMGAIIGGLYASGYTASELDSIFNSIDANALIRDYIPRISKSFYEKKNDEIYALALPFDNFKIGLPQALSKGMYNYTLMNKLLAHVRHVRDFNNLNTPFICIATDVETGEKIVLDKGYLPQAILASGAFPSLFAPVQIDGEYMVDGGIVDNYPIDELKKMGADIIIGIDVQDSLKTIKDIRGATDLLLQISNFSTIRQMKVKVPETDVYIKPDIVGYTVVSFDQGVPIIRRGEEAAEKVIGQLKKIGGHKDLLKEQFVPKYTDSMRISDIKINGVTSYTNRYIHGKLGFKSNASFTFEQLEKGIEQLNATENFSSISYRFDKDGDRDTFVLDLVENPVKRQLKLGIHYDGLYKSAALVNITQRNLLMKSDVASLDVGLGDNLRYNFNYFVDNGFYWSVGVSSKFLQFSAPIPYKLLLETEESLANENNLPAKFILDYKDLNNKLFFSTFYQQKYLLSVGVEHRFFDIKSPTLAGIESRFDQNHYVGGFANLTIDTYDNKYFPRNGFMFKGEFKNYFYSNDKQFENFSVLSGQIGYAKNITSRLSFDIRSRLGTVIGEAAPMGFNFILGGYGFADSENVIPFYGYDYLSLGGDSFIIGSLQLDYEFLKKHHINFSANYGNAGIKIFSNSEDWLARAAFSGYALGYGMQSVIGPIEVKFSYSPETSNTYTMFSIGFWF